VYSENTIIRCVDADILFRLRDNCLEFCDQFVAVRTQHHSRPSNRGDRCWYWVRVSIRRDALMPLMNECV
jgi:hypothetical protein